MKDKRMLMPICLAILALARPTATSALGWPCPELWGLETAATEVVSIFILPDGSGDRLDDARTLGGGRTDATITVTLLDCAAYPIPGFPLEDLWVATEHGGVVFCPGGNVSDQDTDLSGQTTFSGSLRGGGCASTWDDEGLQAYCNGQAFLYPPLDIHFNSADRNGDLQVNLSDISLFAVAYYGAYDYCSDFYWDGALNLSDIALLAQANGMACP